jgi:hypothetical protein
MILPSAAGAIDTETGAMRAYGGASGQHRGSESQRRSSGGTGRCEKPIRRAGGCAGNLAQTRALYTLAIADESSAQANLNALIDRQNEL